MAKCRECEKSVQGKEVKAISFVCECGHQWLVPDKRHSHKLNIPKETK